MNSRYLMTTSEYMKEYYLRNKEKCKLAQSRWRQKNREYVKEYMREYMKTYRKIPVPYKGRRGIVKLEKKSNDGIKFINKPVTLTF